MLLCVVTFAIFLYFPPTNGLQVQLDRNVLSERIFRLWGYWEKPSLKDVRSKLLQQRLNSYATSHTADEMGDWMQITDEYYVAHVGFGTPGRTRRDQTDFLFMWEVRCPS